MYLSLDPRIIDDKSRYMRFVIKGVFKTDIKKTGGLWTLRRETAEDFSYTNIANKIKNFIESHNRIF